MLSVFNIDVKVEVQKEDARPAKAQPAFCLSSMCAAQLLLEFVSDSHPRMLRCWVAQAGDLNKLAASALAATSKLLYYCHGVLANICAFS